MKGTKRSSVLGSLGSTLNAYFSNSTIHGLGYLSSGNRRTRGSFVLQVFYWLAALVAAYGVAIAIVRRSFQEAQDFPIITTVDSISIKDIPFPAITLDAGNIFNPWGTTEKLYNFIDFECYKTPFDCPTEKQAPLKDINPLLQRVTERFFDVVFDQVKQRSIEDLASWRKSKLRLSSSFLFPEFDKSVALLSLIIEKKSSRSAAARRKLARATVETFARFVSWNLQESKGWGSEYFYPIILQEAGWLGINVSEADFICQREEGCQTGTFYREAYANLLLPFIFSRVPYDGLGLGDFISYFSSRVLPVSIKRYNETLPFLSNSQEFGVEEQFADVLANHTNSILNTDVDMTLYELTKLLAKHLFLDGEAKANYFGVKAKCIDKVVTGTWTRAWKYYIGILSTKHTIKSHFGEEITTPPCTNDTLDELLEITNCCLMTEPLKKNHVLMMKALKYAMQPPHFLQPEKEAESDHAWAQESFPNYKLKSYHKFSKYITTYFIKSKAFKEDKSLTYFPWNRLYKSWNRNPRIVRCQYNGKPSGFENMLFCSLFVRSYTNEGFGYSFNNRHFWSKHRVNNSFNQAFYDTMHPYLDTPLPDIIYPQATGQTYGLSAIFQLNKYDQEVFNKFAEATPAIRVAIHDPHKPADLRTGGVEIRPGYESTFLITPSQVKTSPDIERLSVERRKCKFPAESDGLELFSEYTQDGCLFECKLRQASEKCHCVPWNYPLIDSIFSTCDYLGSFCFDRVGIN